MLFPILAVAPAILMLLAALVILVLRLVRPNFGFSWLISTSAALAAWVILLVLRGRLPQTLPWPAWTPAEMFPIFPVYVLDEISWPFSLGLSGLCLGVLLTATARYRYQTNAVAWAGSLGMAALGLVAVQAASPLALLLTWTALDLMETMITLTSSDDRRLSWRAVTALAARMLGTFTVYAAAVGSSSSWQGFSFAGTPDQAGWLYLIGIGLRLGVLPLHLPYRQEPRLRRGLGTVLRLTPAAAGLAALARLPAGSINLESGITGVILGLTALAAFYAGLRWLTADDELIGRPYFVIGLAALAVACVVRGVPDGASAWGLALTLAGGCLFLYSARSLKLLFLPAVGLWALSGLPFSPSASGWAGLAAGPLGGLNMVFLLAQVLLLLGYARHALRPGDSLSGMERWVHVIYPLGLLAMLASHISLGFWGWAGSRTIGVWPVSLAAAVLALVLALLASRASLPGMDDAASQRLTWLQPLTAQAYQGVSAFLSLNWLYRLLAGMYAAGSRVVSVVTSILEGDGGVLWALVILALLVSVLSAGAP